MELLIDTETQEAVFPRGLYLKQIFSIIILKSTYINNASNTEVAMSTTPMEHEWKQNNNHYYAEE